MAAAQARPFIFPDSPVNPPDPVRTNLCAGKSGQGAYWKRLHVHSREGGNPEQHNERLESRLSGNDVG